MTMIPFPQTSQGCGCSRPEWLKLPMSPQPFGRGRFVGQAPLAQAIPVQGALSWIKDLQEQGKSIAGLDLHGPGDPLATPGMTSEILSTLRQHYGDLPLGLTTIGFGLADHTDQLARLGVSRISLLVDTRDKKNLEKIYQWLRPAKRNTPLPLASATLIEEQDKAIAACKENGIACYVITTVYEGINDQEVDEIARWAADFGIEGITLLPGASKGHSDETMSQPSPAAMAKIAQTASKHLPCICLQEAPAPGAGVIDLISTKGNMTGLKPTTERPNLAVLSGNGMDIDLHLGQAVTALIYGLREDGLACLLATRDLPEPGGGDKRWQQIAEILDDCFALLAASAGKRPREILAGLGLPLLLLEENIEGTVDVLYRDSKKSNEKNK